MFYFKQSLFFCFLFSYDLLCNMKAGHIPFKPLAYLCLTSNAHLCGLWALSPHPVCRRWPQGYYADLLIPGSLGKYIKSFLSLCFEKRAEKSGLGYFKKWPLWSISGFYPEIPFEQVVGDNREKELPVNWGGNKLEQNQTQDRPRGGGKGGERPEWV